MDAIPAWHAAQNVSNAVCGPRVNILRKTIYQKALLQLLTNKISGLTPGIDRFFSEDAFVTKWLVTFTITVQDPPGRGTNSLSANDSFTQISPANTLLTCLRFGS
jgi:hypothetical protein